MCENIHKESYKAVDIFSNHDNKHYENAYQAAAKYINASRDEIGMSDVKVE